MVLWETMRDARAPLHDGPDHRSVYVHAETCGQSHSPQPSTSPLAVYSLREKLYRRYRVLSFGSLLALISPSPSQPLNFQALVILITGFLPLPRPDFSRCEESDSLGPAGAYVALAGFEVAA